MSTDVRAKLAELGLELPVAAKPVAAYVPAVRTGNIVFTAGQLPLVNGEMAGTGKVGDAVTPERAKELAQICALNALAAVALVADVNKISKIVRETAAEYQLPYHSYKTFVSALTEHTRMLYRLGRYDNAPAIH